MAGGIAPPLGTSTTALVFSSGNAGAITATQNLGTPMVVNSLNFNVNNAFTLASGANTFQFVGPLPTVNMNGLGSATMTVTGIGNGLTLTDNLTFGGSGPGNLTVAAGITESGGSHSVTIAGGNPTVDTRIVTLGIGSTGNNSFSGGLFLDGGTVGATSASGAFGLAGSTMTVTSNGGYIASAPSFTSLGVLQMNGDLHFIGSASMTLGTNSGTITSAALQGGANVTLYNQGSGSVTIQGNSGTGAASPFLGAVVGGKDNLPEMATSLGGSIALSGVAAQNATPNGSLNRAASFDMQAGGTLLLNNNVLNSVQNSDRIGDTAPVRLRTANLTLTMPAAVGAAGFNPTSLTEVFGDLSGAGAANIGVNVSTSSTITRTDVTTLQPNSLIRVERGTFNFRGSTNITSGLSTLGDGTTAFRGRIILTNPLAGTEFIGGGGTSAQNVSILPNATGGVGTSDIGSSFVTYGADGFRLLQSGEFDAAGSGATLAPADPTNNVALRGATSNNGSVTLNSLMLASSGATDGSVTGTGTITVTSGAVLCAVLNTATTSISNGLAFGGQEAVIGTGVGNLKLTGPLTGSNGLTKGCTGNTLAFMDATPASPTLDNSGLTGQLTLNGGVVEFNTAAALPGRNNPAGTLDPIVVNGSNESTSGSATGLYYAGPNPATLNRPVSVNTGFLTFRLNDNTVTTQSNIGALTVAGPITGVGGVNYQAQALSSSVTVPGEIFVTNTNNTYTGVTRIAAGNIHVNGDSSLGNGGAWDFAGGTMVLENTGLANSRRINFESASTINTNGFNMTLNGPITGYLGGGFSTATAAGLTKTGAGSLTLTNSVNTIAGPVNVYNGSLMINGNLGPSATNGVFVGTIDGGAHYGTLGGAGTLYRNITVSNGGTLAPGASAGTTGIMTVWGSLNMAPTSGVAANLTMDLNGPVAGLGYDQIVSVLQNATASNTVQLGTTVPANLFISLGYAPSSSDVFWLINSTNTVGTGNTTTGAFAGMADGSTITLGTFGGNTYTGTISYSGNFDTGAFSGSGAGFKDVVIDNGVAAPGSMALIALGGMFAIRRKRRTA